jgi:uncharacterized membrane-anchored protein
MKSLMFAAALFVPGIALCATPASTDPAARLAEARALADTVHYQTGTIALKGNLATLSLKPGYKYVNPADSETILSNLWSNPKEAGILGMVVSEDFDPLTSGAWAVIITYSEDGYVKDEDAGKIDYADLMKKIKEGTAEGNKTRAANGYPPIEIVGWAETPRYDTSSHKLYWAKEVKFGDSPEHTLNYNIRILGRNGVLVLNAVSSMEQLSAVEHATPTLLTMVDFTPGHRYTDFKEGTDKVATYGIAALVAGGIAAKVGLFKALWVGILALKKFIILGALAVSRYFKAWWNKLRGKSGEVKLPPPSTTLEPPAGSA